MTKIKRIHLREINELQISPFWRDGSFELVAHNNKKAFILHCERFQAEELATLLWKVVAAEQKQIDNIKAMLRGDEDE